MPGALSRFSLQRFPPPPIGSRLRVLASLPLPAVSSEPDAAASTSRLSPDGDPLRPQSLVPLLVLRSPGVSAPHPTGAPFGPRTPSSLRSHPPSSRGSRGRCGGDLGFLLAWNVLSSLEVAAPPELLDLMPLPRDSRVSTPGLMVLPHPFPPHPRGAAAMRRGNSGVFGARALCRSS